MSDPKITIIMAVYNDAALLPFAIRSLQQQTLGSWELILVDDGSSDGSAEIAEGFGDSRIRVIRNRTNLGLAASLNRAIGMAGAPLIARMDSDDFCYPRRLEAQYEFLVNHPEVSLVGGQAVMFQDNGAPRGVMRPPTAHEKICRGGLLGNFPLYHPAWMGRTGWFRRNEYDPTFRKSQDYELLLRASATSIYANLPEIVLGYRYGLGNLRKRLMSRRFTVKAQVKNLLLRGRFYDFAVGVSVVLAKGIADILCVITRGAKRRRHSLEEISGSEKACWNTVCANIGLNKNSG